MCPLYPLHIVGESSFLLFFSSFRFYILFLNLGNFYIFLDISHACRLFCALFLPLLW